MKKLMMMTALALALTTRGEWGNPVPVVTGAQLRDATNATLVAANAYTDAHSGGDFDTNAVSVVANDAVRTNEVTLALVTATNDLTAAVAAIPPPVAVVDATDSTNATAALSANMGRELQEQIQNLKQRGRYLSIWNSTTGLAQTTPTVDPYSYRAGDYFIVGVTASSGGTNYRPSGTNYSASVPSVEVETAAIMPNDTYYYDGTVWSLLHTQQSSISFGSIAGSPGDNAALASALAAKQGALNAAQTNAVNSGVTSGKVTSWDAHVSDTDNPHQVTAEQVGAVPWEEDSGGINSAVTIGNRNSNVDRGFSSFAVGYFVGASGEHSAAFGDSTRAAGSFSAAFGDGSRAAGIYSAAFGYRAQSSGAYSWTWRGVNAGSSYYESHGDGTFNLNPVGGLSGFWIGETNMAQHIRNLAPQPDLDYALITLASGGTLANGEIRSITATSAFSVTLSLGSSATESADAVLCVNFTGASADGSLSLPSTYTYHADSGYLTLTKGKFIVFTFTRVSASDVLVFKKEF